MLLVDVVMSKGDLLADAKKLCLRKLGTDDVEIEFLWTEHGAQIKWAKFVAYPIPHTPLPDQDPGDESGVE